MSCSKCNDVLVLRDKKATLHFLCEFQELIFKVSDFFYTQGLEFKNDSSICTLNVEDTKDFFSSNIEALESFFSEAEKESIKLYIEDEEKPFSLQSILLAKPLQRYLNLVTDQVFFDIIQNESLTSHFQPIIDMKTNTIYAYEALVRGVKEDGSLMYPDELFEKSKRNDYNFKLDKLCRESALKTAATKKIHQKVFINFMPTAIYDPEFCLASTKKWADQLEFDPSQIVFEVVETELVKDQAHLRSILEFYREKGYKIALDDVGEGYSSLNMLIELKPDIIKVDRNIIDGIDTNEMKQSVYRALVNVAREHGIEILAEGVETADELEMVKSIGVDYVQGYYFAKPSAEPVRKI